MKFISTLDFITNLQGAPVAISIQNVHIKQENDSVVFKCFFSAVFSAFKLIQVAKFSESGHICFLFTNTQCTETSILEWPDQFFKALF